ncbi:hypothetical protein RMATCC62417_15531 [Rhizopus microsporus]|nr:hypothetical protein RMATCC62417_15531 [Rhizopus microsporus]
MSLLAKGCSIFIGTRSYSTFRHLGVEKNAGALQDLLRRVMEIDAEITNTPLPQEYNPNTQTCNAYNTADAYYMDKLRYELTMTDQREFRITSEINAKDALHIVDQEQGGDIFVFSNGSFACWGMQPSQETKFSSLYVTKSEKKRESNVVIEEAKETIDYTVDEDEITDLKGDVAILNPLGIHLSKLAFSYGLGRVAKIKSMEISLDKSIQSLEHSCHVALSTGTSKSTDYNQWLSEFLFIRSRAYASANDGFLGTSSFKWENPELQDIVNKISTRFDAQTRIDIFNRKIDYAMDLNNIWLKYLSKQIIR